MNPEQSDFFGALPVAAKERTNRVEDFGIELRQRTERLCAGDGREVAVTKFELNRMGMQLIFAKSSSNHLGQPGQRRLKYLFIVGVFVERMFVTDGFRIVINA